MTREKSFSDPEDHSDTPDRSDSEDPDYYMASLVSDPVGRKPDQTQLGQNNTYPPPNVQPTASTISASGLEKKSRGLRLAPSEPHSILFKHAGVSRSLPNTPRLPRTPAILKRRDTTASNRAHKVTPAEHSRPAGAEPGIDPRRPSASVEYGDIKQECTIEFVDYSTQGFRLEKYMNNHEFIKFMDDDTASKRESWVKVRWINIGGVSWDVISSLALKYDIHPLALESVLLQRSRIARSKANHYPEHLFVRVLRHTLGSDEDREEAKKQGEDKTLAWSRFNTRGLSRKTDLERGQQEMSQGRGRTRQDHIAETPTIEQLKRGAGVTVHVIPFFIFLFQDGTVISINETPDIRFTAPITARLRRLDTGVREKADPPLLVQSLLSLVIDQAREVVDDYHSRILRLEHDILIKPEVETVRYLHIMSGDLTSLKRTLTPIKTLVYGLRKYDGGRHSALFSPAGELGDITGNVQFMSREAKLYLADTYDHVDYIISSLDVSDSIAENLINYIFNMASYEMNDDMRRLTLTTIIFLPLTLLTGYFGMNFAHMWSVQNNSDVLFWIIAVPVMAIVMPIFAWPDIQRFIQFYKKKWMIQNTKKAIREKTQ